MASQYYDDDLNAHLKAGRRTLAEIFTAANSQRFDVGIPYPMDYYRDMKKRFEVTVSKTISGRALMEVKDPLGNWESKTAYVNMDADVRNVFSAAIDLACTIREEKLMEFLASNGFRES